MLSSGSLMRLRLCPSCGKEGQQVQNDSRYSWVQQMSCYTTACSKSWMYCVVCEQESQNKKRLGVYTDQRALTMHHYRYHKQRLNRGAQSGEDQDDIIMGSDSLPVECPASDGSSMISFEQFDRVESRRFFQHKHDGKGLEYIVSMATMAAFDKNPSCLDVRFHLNTARIVLGLT